MIPEGKTIAFLGDSITEGAGATDIMIAALFDIPVLNLYNDLGIDPMKEEDNIRYTADGLHFNDAGHHIIAKRLGEFLQALQKERNIL